jgi:hypothetical protein
MVEPNVEMVRRPIRTALLLSALLSACSSGEGDVPARGPATKIDPAMAGNVHGLVTYPGTPPPSTMPKVGDPACAAGSSQGPIGDVVVKDGRVANAFAYVAAGLESYVFEIPKDPVVVDQRGCLYVSPRTRGHVFGAETGQEIRFLNSDPTLHNVHIDPKNSPAANFGMGVQGAKRSVRIPKAEVMVNVRCDVHPWMHAYLGVVDHPHFAVTGDDGGFEFTGVPAGHYTIEVWHERFGTKRQVIDVVPRQTAEVKVVYP